MLHSGLDRDRCRPAAAEELAKYGATCRCADAMGSLHRLGSVSAMRRVLSHALIDINEDAEISTPKQVLLDHSSPDLCYQVGSSSSIGKRAKMEDRLVIADLTSEKLFEGTKRALLMAIFDGHGGHEAAEHLADTLQARLLGSASLLKRDYGAALRDVLLDAENTFMQDYFTSGTTALVVLMVDRLLHVANVGDCRAVVCDDTEARALTWDHKPSNKTEKARLEASGAKLSADGYVEVDGRHGGEGIALSRALGGAPIKQAAAAQYSNGSSPLVSPANSELPPHAPQHDQPVTCIHCSCPPPTIKDSPFLHYEQSAAAAASCQAPSSPSSQPPCTPALMELGSGATHPSMNNLHSRQSSTILSESSVIIAEPELFQYSIHQGSEFLILGSDGLWDIVCNKVAVSRVQRWLGEEKYSVDEAAAALVDYAIRMGSMDNVSVLLLRFSSRPLLTAGVPRLVNSALRKTRSVALMAEQQQPQQQPALHRGDSSC